MTVTNVETMVGYDVYRFERQIEIIQKLEQDDPCLVYFREGFTDGKTNFIITEHVQQISLLDYIDSRRKLNERNLAKIIFLVACCINRAHKKNVMHRNLKIESIMVDPDGLDDPQRIDGSLIKIIDWSAAIQIDKKTDQSEILTDLLYRAPQIYKGKYNEKVDVWCLGIIIYILLTG